MQPTILDLLSVRSGHFLMESGHHGTRWLNLAALCRWPGKVKPLAAKIAEHLRPLDIDGVCGPLVEGAFIGLMVAGDLGCEFSYSERFAQRTSDGLFPAGYRVPDAQRESLHGKRIALVNDVINAGSAVKGTYIDLEKCGASVVAVAALLVLGEAAVGFTAERNVPLFSLESLPNRLWTAQTCPLCAIGTPLEDVEQFASNLRQE